MQRERLPIRDAPREGRLTRGILENVSDGQSRRTIVERSQAGYISKCRVLTRILNSIEDLREDALEVDANGAALEHTGAARGVFRLKLPITVDTARCLFAAVSIDGSLVRGRRRNAAVEEGVDVVAEDVADLAAGELDGDDIVDGEVVEVLDVRNPAQNIRTVCAQTYVNYKSALKWWHEHNDPDGKEKIGHPWPAEVDSIISAQNRAYKRDVGMKKRSGVMPQREGKLPYNITGYQELCHYFNRMSPAGHRGGWMEGIFCQLFTKFSVNTMGRSDNIDDMLLANLDWENDAMTILFGNTKSDIEGERTSEKKRLFANPFKPKVSYDVATLDG